MSTTTQPVAVEKGGCPHWNTAAVRGKIVGKCEWIVVLR